MDDFADTLADCGRAAEDQGLDFLVLRELTYAYSFCEMGADTVIILSKLSGIGPLLFGFGFVAPLIAQSMDALGLAAPFGLSNLALGLIIGVVLGLVATRRGTWI